MNILTRPKDKNKELLDLLGAEEFTVFVEPLIYYKYVLLDNSEIVSINTVIGLFFFSSQGVLSLKNHKGFDVLENQRIAAVGEKTAQTFHEEFLRKPNFVSSGRTSSDFF